MATVIKLKNSVVKDRVPSADAIQIGELCVGAHSESPALFFKDNADNIIKIEPGAGAESSPNPPSDPGTGDLWFDTDNDTLNYWDGTAWVELGEAGDSPVKSVNTKTGAVVLDANDVGAATAAQGTKADSALQAGDDVSELNNDAGYLTGVDGNGFVDVDGDNMTGNLTLGTDKITLDAATGNATFTGTVTAATFNIDALPALA